MSFKIGKLQQRLKKGTAFDSYAPIFRQACLDLTLLNNGNDLSPQRMVARAAALAKSSERLESVRPADKDLSDLHLRLIGLCRASLMEVKYTVETIPLNPYVHPEQARQYRHAMSEADAWGVMRQEAAGQFGEDVDRLEKVNPELFSRLDLESLFEQAASILQQEAGELSESPSEPGVLRADDF